MRGNVYRKAAGQSPVECIGTMSEIAPTKEKRRRRTGRPSIWGRMPAELLGRINRLICDTELGPAAIYGRLDLDSYGIKPGTLRRYVSRRRAAIGLRMANRGRSSTQQRINAGASALLSHLESMHPDYVVDAIVRRLAFVRFVDIDRMKGPRESAQRDGSGADASTRAGAGGAGTLEPETGHCSRQRDSHDKDDEATE